MKKDPIVEEIHQIREKMLAECGGDLEKFMDHLKARELKDKAQLISWEEMTTSKHIAEPALIGH
ncbi:MAG: hypothetical protein AAB267_08755 [Candidatus Desantisbacteria bacterium]